MTVRSTSGAFDGGERLLARYRAVRERSTVLAAPLSAEDCCAQSMPDASPVKWHLAHTTWFFETFILERCEPQHAPYHPAFRLLFNSYYIGVGDRHPRAQRGLITRPSLTDVIAYRSNVDDRISRILEGGVPDDVAGMIELGLQHEQQHQELMLTDIKHLLSINPLQPVFCDAPLAASPQNAPLEWISLDAGIVDIGHPGGGFSFDNERPRHRQFVEPFVLASHLVTNYEFAAFIDAGGYTDPDWWLSEGWDWVSSNRLKHPLYWQRAQSDGWKEFTLHGMQTLDPYRPVTHVSYFEADAYARWADARLPTESEWEMAVTAADMARHADTQLADATHLHPRADTQPGLSQLFGECWQWTSSSYAPYPGFKIADGAIGEYNGKFMVNQYVLRGSSCITSPGHARASYRNFFPTSACWQFSGIRLARSSTT